jgi:ABC-type nitrate/sulfonate/bicarbonate transport system permease component
MARQPLALALALMVAWQALAALGWLPAYLASPAAVAQQFLSLASTGELERHSAVSLYRSLAGLALGAVLGIGVGLGAGVSRRVTEFCEPLVSLTYPVPKVAFLPILLVWFGISDISKILLIAISCFYPCYISALYGVRAVNPLWVWAAQNMGATPRQVFIRVFLPAASVHIFSGLRVSLALAFILMLASEMIGSSNRLGLGFLILSADAGGRFDMMFAAILAIAILGFAADRLLLWARRRLLAGQTATEGAVYA